MVFTHITTYYLLPYLTYLLQCVTHRYDKCIAVGMKPELVLSVEEKCEEIQKLTSRFNAATNPRTN